MISDPDRVSVGSFACQPGDVECKPEDIANFAEIWRSASDADFSTMGCGTFRKMSAPVEEYVVECVRQTIGNGGVAAPDIGYIVFSTTDASLRLLGRDFAVGVMAAAGLVRCIPVMLSFQQCCSSMSALRYGWDLFSGADVGNIVVVSLDFTPDDADRIRSFALFSDAVTSCLISRVSEGDLRLVSTAVNVDYSGLSGQDSFLSRQNVAQASLSGVFTGSGMLLEDVTKVFPTNLYKPLTLFNATVAGVQKDKLHFADTLRSYGHCGNCDWMINLMDFQQATGIRSGESYLAQASAPGFFASGLFLGR